MDAGWFDRLTRIVASSTSRRAAGGALLGVLAGLLGLPTAEDAAAHNTMRRCRKIKNRRRRAACRRRARRHTKRHKVKRRRKAPLPPPPPECQTPATCPQPSQACAQATCDGGKCSVEPASSDRVCRSTAGDCDIAETCDGFSLDCPADAFQSGVECGPPPNDCEVAAECDGSSATCPPNEFAEDGTVCGGRCLDSAQVLPLGVCSAGGVCNASPLSCDLYQCDFGTGACFTSCSDSGQCASDAFCNDGHNCEAKRDNGESCSDDDWCTSGSCDDGTCA